MTTTTAITPENRQGFLMVHWGREGKTCPDPLRFYYCRANRAPNSPYWHLMAFSGTHACGLQVQQAESGKDYHPWRWMSTNDWFGTEIPQFFCLRDGGDSSEFVLHRDPSFSGGKKLWLSPLWFVRQCVLYFIGYFPFPISRIHSLFGFSFTSSKNLHTLQSLSASGKNNQNFNSLSDNVLSASQSYLICCHLIINTLFFPKATGAREAGLGKIKEFIWGHITLWTKLCPPKIHMFKP